MGRGTELLLALLDPVTVDRLLSRPLLADAAILVPAEPQLSGAEYREAFQRR